LVEFSSNVPPEVGLTSKDINNLLRPLREPELEVTPQQIAFLRLLISWPKGYIFPALDLLRMSLLHPKVNQELASGKDAPRLVDTLLVCATDVTSTPNQITALKALCNLFSHVMGEALAVTWSPTVLKAVTVCSDSANKSVQTALATLYFNYSVHVTKEAGSGRKCSPLDSDTFFGISSSLKDSLDAEAKYRLLAGFGNLVTSCPDVREMAKSGEVMALLQTVSQNSRNPDKVRDSAEAIHGLLK
jgi:phospholipase A-2-activating protein